MLLVLTEARVGLKRRTGVDGVESGGVARRCARVQVVAEVLRVCWCVKEVRASIAKA